MVTRHVRSSQLTTITWILVTLLMFVTLVSPVAYADRDSAAKATGAYDYPISPGTHEWEAFTTHSEMLAACQIPEPLLGSMSTKGLVETVADYPLMIDMWAYDDIQAGFDAVASNFNGIQELLSREDAATSLIARYKEFDLSEINNSWAPLQRGNFVLGSVSCIEMLLANDDVIDNMSEVERLDLLAQVRANYAVKQGKAKFYMHPGLTADSLIIERVTGHHWSERGDPTNYCTSYPVTNIKTPKGSQVPCTYRWGSGCIDWSDPASVNAAWKAAYPRAFFLGTATWKYNCHSYAWYQASQSNTLVIGCTPSIYWTDGSASWKGVWPTGYFPARRVFYDSAWGETYDHSGICVQLPCSSGYCKGVYSKWGPGPLMGHAYNYCPYMDYAPTVNIYG